MHYLDNASSERRGGNNQGENERHGEAAETHAEILRFGVSVTRAWRGEHPSRQVAAAPSGRDDEAIVCACADLARAA
jgi:hypothetical protein